jgi:membrane-anchored protein YejM (alkaline phosphatase superfamily)
MFNFSNTNTCIHSKKHFSGELSTVYGTFSYLYSVNIYHYWPMADKKIKSFPLQLLKKNEYTLFGGAASNLRGWERKIDFMLDNFDYYKEFKAKNYQRDYDLVNWIIKKYKTRDKSKPYFFFAFFNATHHNYFYPKKFEKFKPAINQNFNYFGGDSVKKDKNQIFNRYKNSAFFVDSLFKKLISAFKEDIEKNNLIVVVTGDHGEEFFDQGKLGHGKISNNPRSKVPLLLCLPNITTKTVNISSHVDILPTIIDYLQPIPHISPSFYSNGISLLKSEDLHRYVVVSGFDFPRRSREVTLINNYGKLLLKKTTDQINVTNEFYVSKKMDLNDKIIRPAEPTPYLDKIKILFEKDIVKFYKH